MMEKCFVCMVYRKVFSSSPSSPRDYNKNGKPIGTHDSLGCIRTPPVDRRFNNLSSVINVLVLLQNYQ